MHSDSTTVILHTLKQQVIETRAAYYRGVTGITYEDMAAAARRYLTILASVDRAAGRKAKKVTSGSIAHLLRAL
jgi:hypothetical protein